MRDNGRRNHIENNKERERDGRTKEKGTRNLKNKCKRQEKLINEKVLKVGRPRVKRGGEIIKQKAWTVKRKKDGKTKTRLIMDGHPLAEGMKKTMSKQKFTDLMKIRASFKADMYFTSLDLKDAYHNIAIREESRNLLVIETENGEMVYLCLAQGLPPAPNIFTQLMKIPLRELGKWRIIISAFLDDFILQEMRKRLLEIHTWISVNLITQLGLIINATKSQLKAKKHVNHLGFTIDSKKKVIKVEETRRKELMLSFKKDMENVKKKKETKVRDIAKMIGERVALKLGVRHTMWMCRELMILLNKLRVEEKKDWEDEVIITDQNVIEDLEWWTKEWIYHNGVPMEEVLEILRAILQTDASLNGWGVILWMLKQQECKQQSVEEIKQKATREESAGWWSRETQKEATSINWLEMKTMLNGVMIAKNKIQSGANVLMETDSMCNYWFWTKEGTTNKKFNNMMREAKRIVVKKDWRLKVRYVPSLTIEADALSRRERKEDNTDWRLCQEEVKRAFSTYGDRMVDLFATSENKVTKRFCSATEQPNTDAVDAFSIDWRRYREKGVWMNPPYIDKIIWKAIRKQERENIEATICVPDWKDRTWRTEVIRRASSYYIIEARKGLFQPGRKLKIEEVPAPRFNVIIALLPGDTKKC